MSLAESEDERIEGGYIKSDYIKSDLGDSIMLLVRTNEKCRRKRIISVITAELCDLLHSDVIAHLTSRGKLIKIFLGSPIILHTLIAFGNKLNTIMLARFCKIQVPSVEFELRLNIRVIPEAIKITTF